MSKRTNVGILNIFVIFNDTSNALRKKLNDSMGLT